ncbi:hypothetical protein [Terriglobus saanensis]|nr:hypothetical protein [Terriglobus saanensis]
MSLKTYFTFGAALIVAGSAFGQQLALRSANDALLPEAPSSSVSAAEGTGVDLSSPLGTPQSSATYNQPAKVSKYTTIVDPGQSVERLSGMQKLAYSFREQASINSLIGATFSAGLSHGLDSSPHYGHNKEAFAQRFGAAYARQTTQAVMTDGVFSPLFHDDPRYYVLGNQHKFFARVFYAATRVVVVRSDEGNNRFNAPLIAGYAVAAGVNNAYYPPFDRGAKETGINFLTSLGGAVLSFEVSEFYHDALRAVHLKH